MKHLQTITVSPAPKSVSLSRIAAKFDRRTAAAVAAYMRAHGVNAEIEQVDEHLFRVRAA
jgi:hypothetical protein